MQIESVYRPGALTCEINDPMPVVASKMASAHVGALAVLDGNMIVGVISERDVVRAVAEHENLRTVTSATYASRHVQIAELNEDTHDVARRMLDNGIRHLPVVQGRVVVGMISIRDLLAVETWM